MGRKRRQARHIADLHFMDPKVAGLRGFRSWQGHDESVCVDWERSVPDDDTPVYVYGDICKGNLESWYYALGVISELPGKKHHICGNHGPDHPMHNSWRTHQAEALEVFASTTIASSIHLGGRTVMQSHLPYHGDHDHIGERYTQWRLRDEGRWLVHGHVHDAWTVQGRQICVSWEKWRNGFATDNDLIALMERGERLEVIAAEAGLAAEMSSRAMIMDWGGGS